MNHTANMQKSAATKQQQLNLLAFKRKASDTGSRDEDTQQHARDQSGKTQKAETGEEDACMHESKEHVNDSDEADETDGSKNDDSDAGPGGNFHRSSLVKAPPLQQALAALIKLGRPTISGGLVNRGAPHLCGLVRRPVSDNQAFSAFKVC